MSSYNICFHVEVRKISGAIMLYLYTRGIFKDRVHTHQGNVREI